MKRLLSSLSVVALLTVPQHAVPQTVPAEQSQTAVLVADQVFITRDKTLVAQGNVEAFQGNTRVRAQSIRYSETTGALEIEGPITLSEGTETILLADAAELDPDLQNGILTGARLILSQQVQLAARQINRVEGRYSQLYKTAATSCHVCDDGRPPLWQIRARRVVHDQQEQQLYFDEAQFRIRNVPVFYLPRLRLPDPTLDRATGFLTPSIRSTSQLGTGIKVPYFIKIGDHRDLTLTPYLSTRTRTLEFRYRQAVRNGRMGFEGAITRDDELPGETRGYLFGTGQFDLQRDYTLDFNVELTTDRAYLTEYGYSSSDRLSSEITVSRAQRDEYIRGSVFRFETLRDGEVNATQPTFVLDGAYERRFFPDRIGGELRFGLQAHAHRRSSDRDTDGPDPDLITDGRDVARINGQIDWINRAVLRGGFVVDTRVGASFNFFDITQDASFAQNHSDLTTHAALALRYPMMRRARGGAVDVLEPVIQLGYVDGTRLVIPNEESTRVEFDQGNLLSLSRFPRPDRRERGATVALGMTWTRDNPNGWDAHIAVGQVLRRNSDPAFTTSSGLDGAQSDYLLAGQIITPEGLTLTGRSLFDDSFEFAKAELRGDWSFERGRLGGSYLWLDADAAEERTQAVSEFALDGSYRINANWQANADWRFDVADDRAATAGLGLTYFNECVSVDLSVRRRYSSSTSVEPSTDFGFNVGLRGFAANSGTERFERSCRN